MGAFTEQASKPHLRCRPLFSAIPLYLPSKHEAVFAERELNHGWQAPAKPQQEEETGTFLGDQADLDSRHQDKSCSAWPPTMILQRRVTWVGLSLQEQAALADTHTKRAPPVQELLEDNKMCTKTSNTETEGKMA